MTRISIETLVDFDLEDYEEEIKDTYCNAYRCLNKKCGLEHTERLKEYVKDLDKRIYIFDETLNPKEILRDLKYLLAEM